MPDLTSYTSYADAQRHFSKPALWDLFDGDRGRLNIAHECIDRHAALAGARVAVRIAHADGRDEEISFAELALWSGRFANELAARGIAPGARVAIMLEPSLAFYACFFGAIKAGCVAVPLFTLFGPDGLRLRLADCTPALLLLAPQKAELAPVADCAVALVDDNFMAALAGRPGGFTTATSSNDMAMYQYTSGTTRELPEAVRHRHRAVVTVMIAALYATGVRPGDLFMCPSSPAWGHGLWHGTVAPLAMGVSIATYAGRFDAARLLQAIADFEITNLSAAATHYRMMKNADSSGAGGGGRNFAIEKLSFTGEPIDSNTAQWAEATFGVPVCSIYGSTEVGVILADYPGAADHVVKPGALGLPVPGVELAVVDGEDRPCPPGQSGEIVVRRGAAWFRSKDLGHTDEDGYYYHDGRADDVIISSGWTMSAVEIEDVLLKHADVAECAVIAVPDEERGQIPKAFIVSDRSGDSDFIAEVQNLAKTRLAAHEYPRQVAFVAALPKTPAGKVNRKALREAEAAGE
jgi:acetyl-CoA synthetase